MLRAHSYQGTALNKELCRIWYRHQRSPSSSSAFLSDSLALTNSVQGSPFIGTFPNMHFKSWPFMCDWYWKGTFCGQQLLAVYFFQVITVTISSAIKKISYNRAKMCEGGSMWDCASVNRNECDCCIRPLLIDREHVPISSLYSLV